jgi:6,7-dimethyl-8-ribityllumazine synthase
MGGKEMSVKTIQGNLVSKDLSFGIVAGRFNEFISSKLVGGAIDGLVRHGVDEGQIDLVWVPGAFEIPLAAQKMAQTKRYNAIICVGAVIRGSTPHFEYVANEVTKGIAHISLQTGIPIIFGVLTTENIEQAIERAGTKAGNKGFDAALTAIEMCNLLSQL